MPTCEWCGKEFDYSEASMTFEGSTWLLSYDNIRRCLCGDCALEAINDEHDGVYYEHCEKCGQSFDLITERQRFAMNFPEYNGTELRDHWNGRVLCSDCAIEEYLGNQ